MPENCAHDGSAKAWPLHFAALDRKVGSEVAAEIRHANPRHRFRPPFLEKYTTSFIGRTLIGTGINARGTDSAIQQRCFSRPLRGHQVCGLRALPHTFLVDTPAGYQINAAKQSLNTGRWLTLETVLMRRNWLICIDAKKYRYCALSLTECVTGL